MIKFIGEHTAKVDDKGRVVFPSAFKNLFPKEEQAAFVIKRDLFEECLTVYTYTEWERESELVKSKLNFFNKEHAIFWREYMRDRVLVEPDAKLGRILIPKKLLMDIGVEREVVFAGNDHKIEIWGKEKYEQTKMEQEDFSTLAQKILG